MDSQNETVFYQNQDPFLILNLKQKHRSEMGLGMTPHQTIEPFKTTFSRERLLTFKIKSFLDVTGLLNRLLRLKGLYDVSHMMCLTRSMKVIEALH